MWLWLTLFSGGCRNGVPENRYTIATLKGPSSMGMIRLIDSLDNLKHSEVRVKILNEPLQVRKMMIDGTADFAILPSTMAAIIYNKGLDYRLVAIPVWGTLYLIGNNSSIARWEDLKGKRVFLMARGMTPDILFRYLLQKNGLNPDRDLTLDYSFPTHIDLANAINAGQAGLAVISEPVASLAIKNNPTLNRIFSLTDEWEKLEDIPIAETAFMASSTVIKNNPIMVEQILSAYEASTRWVNQYPDSAAALIIKHGILPDREAAVDAIPRLNLKFVKAETVKGQIEAYFTVFYMMNPDVIGGKIPDEDFIYK